MRKQRASALLRVKALPPRRVPLDARFTPLGNAPKTATTSANEHKTKVQWPPPRRRVVAGEHGTSFASVGVRPAVDSALPKNLQEDDGDESEGPADAGGSFDGLRAAGAFGTATLIVFATATVAVWGVRTQLEVDNVRGFVFSLAFSMLFPCPFFGISWPCHALATDHHSAHLTSKRRFDVQYLHWSNVPLGSRHGCLFMSCLHPMRSLAYSNLFHSRHFQSSPQLLN